jgi:hypothetical protein
MRESGPQGTDGSERQEIHDRGKNPDLETGRRRRNDFGGVPGANISEVTFHPMEEAVRADGGERSQEAEGAGA